MNYQLLRDFYIVYVDEVWESQKTKSGLITVNTAVHNKDNSSEEVEDRGEHKRRYGWVVETPASFSDNALEMIDPGSPAPRRFVGHDWIQLMKIAGYRGYRDHENPAGKYYPSTFEQYETIKMRDMAKLVDVQRGDKVYFDHKSTDMERYMGRYKQGHLFSVQVNEIICSVKEKPVFEGYSKYKKNKIIPQGGWTLVKVLMEDWKDITTPSGVIIKVAPEALPLQGKVMYSQKKELEGQLVLFERDADAPIVVEGQELTSMRMDDILATIKPK